MALKTPEGWRQEREHHEHALLVAIDGSGSVIVGVPRAMPPDRRQVLREFVERLAPHVTFGADTETRHGIRVRAHLDNEHVEAGVVTRGLVAMAYLLSEHEPGMHAATVALMIASALDESASPFAHWLE